jgi:addiction module HigA family antidote
MTPLLPPVHPGEILADEFLGPLGLTQYRLAKDTSVPARRINEIVKGERAISADTALRLARFFGTSDLFWLNLQARYDLDVQRDLLGKRLEAEVHVFARPAAPVGSLTSPKRRSKTNRDPTASPAASAASAVPARRARSRG